MPRLLLLLAVTDHASCAEDDATTTLAMMRK